MTNPTHPASGEALAVAVQVVAEWVDMASEATAQPPLAVIKHVAICQSELDALRALLSATPSPDKLKIAIEALLAIKIADDHREKSKNRMVWILNVYLPAIAHVRKALAALKAEG